MVCGELFHDVQWVKPPYITYVFLTLTRNDIPGFQNRLGLFFFLLALFGFSTLTSLNVFASERLLFVRERANGYYAPITYFLAKVLFDIIPLRIIPPILMGAIIYPMTGLVPDTAHFRKLSVDVGNYSLRDRWGVGIISWLASWYCHIDRGR